MVQSKIFSTSSGISILELIYKSDLIAKSVVLLLVILSVWSWSIVIEKFFKYRSVFSQMKNFESTFWSGGSIDQLFENVRRNTAQDPLSITFIAVMTECRRHDKRPLDSASKVGLKERIYQTMNLVRNREAERLEINLNILATIGSNAPFIGIFGMVWSIINSFHAIANAKNVSIATIAPSISEALFVTAVGLLVAIPAVIFYNILVSKADLLINKMEDFSGELHTLLSRAIDNDKI